MVYIGTTALGIYIRDNNWYLFNIGDCQALLSRSQKSVPLSEGHKPGVKEELERIKAANGWITEEK